MKILITSLVMLFSASSYAFKCTKEYRPVCANGKFYSNHCMAKAAGEKAEDIKKGSCQKVEKTSPKKPENIDKAVCVCPMIWMPVCGVDGKTYGSACNARCEKVVIKHKGSCKKVETH